VHAIRYATLETQRAAVFLGGDAAGGPIRLDYFVWTIQGDGRTFVVDTGFKAAVAQRRGREWLRCPTQGLKALGIDAAAVEDVIVTHLHYDHAGNLDLFPRARLHLQEREGAFVTGHMMRNRHHSFSGLIEEDDVHVLVRTLFGGRVEYVDGEAEVAPGLSVHRVGGHTPGLQMVRVWTRRGWLVLASDAAHFYENIAAERPFYVVVDLAEMFDGWRTARALASSPDHIVPGHDPLVMKQYPAVPGLEGVAVRLDGEPAFSAMTPSATGPGARP
jgi:glyoxylase-like metal-dependent hydrolase (beta-lactamase superfamily II)